MAFHSSKASGMARVMPYSSSRARMWVLVGATFWKV